MDIGSRPLSGLLKKIKAVNKRLKAIRGGLEDIITMSKAMRGQDAVLSALGPKPGEMLTALTKRNWTMEQFAANTLMAMKKAKVKKLVLFSSAGLFPARIFSSGSWALWPTTT